MTAYVDVSRANEDGAREVEIRADNLRRELLDGGADESLVEAVASRIVEPTGHGGDTSRVVIAHGDQLATDMVLATVVPGQHHHGPIAHLLPLAREVQ